MTTTTTDRPVVAETPRSRSRPTAAASVASDAAVAVKKTADDAAIRLSGVAAMGRSAYEDANRRIEASPDEMVRLGAVMSFGFAAGLLVGGANRVLVGGALVPAAMLGLALLERTTAGRPGGVSTGGR